jgi:hypothetical protein
LTKRLLLGKAAAIPINCRVSALIWNVCPPPVEARETGTVTVSVADAAEAPDAGVFWAMATVVPSRVV